jgi:hypothetical protein
MANAVEHLSFKQRYRVLAGLIEIHGANAKFEGLMRQLAAEGIDLSSGQLRTFWRRTKRAIHDDPLNRDYDPVLAELVRQIIEEKRNA